MTHPHFDQVVQNGCLSADAVAIGFEGTGAEKTRAIIRRALEALEANGIIEIKDAEDWNQFYMADPPYKFPEFQ